MAFFGGVTQKKVNDLIAALTAAAVGAAPEGHNHNALYMAIGSVLANTASKAANGWWQCGDTGVTIQWGYGGGSNAVSITFPLAFENSCRAVVGMTLDTSSVGVPYTNSAPTKTGFILDHAGGNTTEYSFWLAIGY